MIVCACASKSTMQFKKPQGRLWCIVDRFLPLSFLSIVFKVFFRLLYNRSRLFMKVLIASSLIFSTRTFSSKSVSSRSRSLQPCVRRIFGLGGSYSMSHGPCRTKGNFALTMFLNSSSSLCRDVCSVVFFGAIVPGDYILQLVCLAGLSGVQVASPSYMQAPARSGLSELCCLLV